MDKIIIIFVSLLGISLIFLFGIIMGATVKKKEVIFVHKKCDGGKCVSYNDLDSIKTCIRNINEFTDNRIVTQTNEINKLLNK